MKNNYIIDNEFPLVNEQHDEYFVALFGGSSLPMLHKLSDLGPAVA